MVDLHRQRSKGCWRCFFGALPKQLRKKQRKTAETSWLFELFSVVGQ
jgi:hypothetical protein